MRSLSNAVLHPISQYRRNGSEGKGVNMMLWIRLLSILFLAAALAPSAFAQAPLVRIVVDQRRPNDGRDGHQFLPRRFPRGARRLQQWRWTLPDGLRLVAGLGNKRCARAAFDPARRPDRPADGLVIQGV